MKLIGSPLSPFVRKVNIIAMHKNIEYEWDKSVSPLSMPDWFFDINPLKRIPALIIETDGDALIINDSSAICAYFEKYVPTPSFYPHAAAHYAHALWIEEYADTAFAADIGLNVFRPIFFNIAAGKSPDMDAAQNGVEALRKKHFPYLTQFLQKDRYFYGADLSIADIAVFTQLINLLHTGYQLRPQDGENLYAAFNRFLDSPLIADMVAQEKNIFEKMNFKAVNFT